MVLFKKLLSLIELIKNGQEAMVANQLIYNNKK